jgi:hypothetical protein
MESVNEFRGLQFEFRQISHYDCHGWNKKVMVERGTVMSA